MNCTNCNQALAPGAAFCTNCGTQISNASPQPVAAPAPVAPAAAPTPASPSATPVAHAASVPAGVVPTAPIQPQAAQAVAVVPTVNETMSVQYAGFWRRFAAVFVDGVLLGILVQAPLNIIFPPQDSQENPIATLIYMVVYFLYVAVLTSSSWQGTVGKKAFGVRVVDANTLGKLSFFKALLREIMKIVSALILLIGYLMMLWDGKKQALHDKAVGSLVVKSS